MKLYMYNIITSLLIVYNFAFVYTYMLLWKRYARQVSQIAWWR